MFLPGAGEQDVGKDRQDTAESLNSCAETPVAAEPGSGYRLSGYSAWVLTSGGEMELAAQNIGEPDQCSCNSMRVTTGLSPETGSSRLMLMGLCMKAALLLHEVAEINCHEPELSVIFGPPR